MRQKIVQNRLNIDDLSSDIAEYAAGTLTINGQNGDMVSCYIACGVPWDPRTQVAIRSRARGEALVCDDFSAHSIAWVNKATTTRWRRLQDILDRLDFGNITDGLPTYVRAEVQRSVIDLTPAVGRNTAA